MSKKTIDKRCLEMHLLGVFCPIRVGGIRTEEPIDEIKQSKADYHAPRSGAHSWTAGDPENPLHTLPHPPDLRW